MHAIKTHAVKKNRDHVSHEGRVPIQHGMHARNVRDTSVLYKQSSFARIDPRESVDRHRDS